MTSRKLTLRLGWYRCCIPWVESAAHRIETQHVRQLLYLKALLCVISNKLTRNATSVTVERILIVVDSTLQMYLCIVLYSRHYLTFEPQCISRRRRQVIIGPHITTSALLCSVDIDFSIDSVCISNRRRKGVFLNK